MPKRLSTTPNVVPIGTLHQPIDQPFEFPPPPLAIGQKLTFLNFLCLNHQNMTQILYKMLFARNKPFWKVHTLISLEKITQNDQKVRFF